MVGVGYGKAKEVPLAIQKGVEDAKKNLFQRAQHRSTITHQMIGRSGAGKVLLKPASAGTGVIAGGGVRASSSWPGSATSSASRWAPEPDEPRQGDRGRAETLRTPEEVAELRGLSINKVLGLTVQEPVVETINGAPAPEAEAEVEEAPVTEVEDTPPPRPRPSPSRKSPSRKSAWRKSPSPRRRPRHEARTVQVQERFDAAPARHAALARAASYRAGRGGQGPPQARAWSIAFVIS